MRLKLQTPLFVSEALLDTAQKQLADLLAAAEEVSQYGCMHCLVATTLTSSTPRLTIKVMANYLTCQKYTTTSISLHLVRIGKFVCTALVIPSVRFVIVLRGRQKDAELPLQMMGPPSTLP